MFGQLLPPDYDQVVNTSPAKHPGTSPNNVGSRRSSDDPRTRSDDNSTISDSRSFLDGVSCGDAANVECSKLDRIAEFGAGY